MSSGYVYLVELLDMGFESDREWPKTGFNSLTFGEFAFDGLDDALNVLFHLVTVFVLLIILCRLLPCYWLSASWRSTGR